MSKKLVAYFSASGVTANVAKGNYGFFRFSGKNGFFLQGELTNCCQK